MKILRTLMLLSAAALSACGGGGGSGPSLGGVSTSSSSSSSGGAGSSSSSSGGSVAADNVLTISVNSGLNGDYTNGAFASVTVCVPGSSTCATIPDVLIDTGSSGLRLLASTVSGLGLSSQSNGSGQTTAECAAFGDGFTWGPVATADIKLSGEMAHSVPINLIGSSSFTGAPTDCSTGNGQEEDTAAKLRANGILGIGLFQQDCGSGCADGATSMYWNCNAGNCTEIAQPLSKQVQNPVGLFASDNNGVVVVLPSISSAGAPSVSGSVIFGIGTQNNNALGSAKIIAANGFGEFSSVYNNNSYSSSFIDSGSNALYFNDPGHSLTQCTHDTGFYCPPSTTSLSATMTGSNSVTVTVPFSVANAENLSGSNTAFDDLAGIAGGNLSSSFDWGLPFFFGRTTFFAIENKSTPGGTGPYFAF